MCIYTMWFVIKEIQYIIIDKAFLLTLLCDS